MNSGVHERTYAMFQEALGPLLREALGDPLTTEVMINPDGTVWVERQGQSMTWEGTCDVLYVERIIRLAAALDYKEVSENAPSVAVTLPGGQRFQGFMPPRVAAHALTIRTHQRQVLTREHYVPHLCPGDVFDRCVEAIRAKETVLIAGMMSSGKSTFMSTLLGYVEATERLVTVEDVQELQVQVPNRVALFATPSTVHQAIDDAWRSAAHRVLVGEIRNGPAAIAALDVWMGLKGGLCTIHGKSGRDALQRLEHLCGEVNRNGDFRPRIASVIDLVVYLEQVEGKRQVQEVLQLNGWGETGYDITTLFAR